MRYPVPENKVVFMRLHKELDKMIEEEMKRKNKRRATVVARILSSYIENPFPLSPSSSSLFLKRGRGREKMRGRGMNITMKKVVWNEIRIRGEKEGMKETEMRTSIIFSYLEKENKKTS